MYVLRGFDSTSACEQTLQQNETERIGTQISLSRNGRVRMLQIASRWWSRTFWLTGGLQNPYQQRLHKRLGASATHTIGQLPGAIIVNLILEWQGFKCVSKTYVGR